jgi:hypothetical protein
MIDPGWDWESQNTAINTLDTEIPMKLHNNGYAICMGGIGKRIIKVRCINLLLL